MSKVETRRGEIGYVYTGSPQFGQQNYLCTFSKQTRRCCSC